MKNEVWNSKEAFENAIKVIIPEEPQYKYIEKYRVLPYTLYYIKFFIDRYSKLPDFNEFAIKLVHGAKNKKEIAERIYHAVKDNIWYVNDPRKIEYVRSPKKVLLLRAGDCECQTTLVCALLKTLGIPHRAVMVKTNPIGDYSHIYSEAFVDGKWWVMDTTYKKGYFGWVPPNVYDVRNINFEKYNIKDFWKYVSSNFGDININMLSQEQQIDEKTLIEKVKEFWNNKDEILKVFSLHDEATKNLIEIKKQIENNKLPPAFIRKYNILVKENRENDARINVAKIKFKEILKQLSTNEVINYFEKHIKGIKNWVLDRVKFFGIGEIKENNIGELSFLATIGGLLVKNIGIVLLAISIVGAYVIKSWRETNTHRIIVKKYLDPSTTQEEKSAILKLLEKEKKEDIFDFMKKVIIGVAGVMLLSMILQTQRR